MKLSNKGNISPSDWVTALALFAMSYLVWSYTQPIMSALIASTSNMGLPAAASTVLTYAQTMYQYGIVICALTAILYLIMSAIRTEEEDRLIPYGGY